MIIRALLIACVCFSAILALRSTGSSQQLAVRRIAMLGFTGAWIVAVLWPDLLTRMAVFVGVGRGTDLLLYVLVVAVVLMAIGIYQRFTRMEQRIADLTRELAIRTADRATLGTPRLPELHLVSPTPPSTGATVASDGGVPLLLS